MRWFLLLPALLAFAPVPPRTQAALGADEFRLLPIRVHLLRARAAPDLHCKLQEADVRRILAKVNGIWKQAGIQFYAESVPIEEAANQELYRELGANRTLEHLRLVRPRSSLSEWMFHVYYIGEMRPNGICLQGSYQLLFVKEAARLFQVPGGMDEDLPRVSAHEIGHALHLPHRQDRTNLMASGTTGTSLNEAEIATARAAAEALDWHLKPAEALALADRLAGEKRAPAAALYTALAGLPGGEVARAAQQHLREAGN